MNPEPSVYDVEFCAIDFETTGVYATSEAVEAGAVRFNLMNDSRVTFSQLVKPPTKKIPPDATNVHGITNEMVFHAPTLESVLPVLEDFSRGSVLVAHHSSFDLRYVTEGMRNLPVINTLRLAKNFLSSDSYRLSKLVESPTYHRALPDALSCMELFKKCIRAMERRRGGAMIYLWEIVEK